MLRVDVRNPLTGEVYPAGTPIPMTAFARKVLNDLPAPTNAGAANNLQILQEFTNRTPKAGGKVDIQFSPRLSAFGRVGWRDADIFDNPPIAGRPAARGNAETYVTNKQFSSGLTYTPAGTSLFEARFGWSTTKAGKNPCALVQRRRRRAEQVYGITGLPTDPRVGGRPADAADHRLLRPRAARRPTRSGSTRRCSTRRSTTPGCRAVTR